MLSLTVPISPVLNAMDPSVTAAEGFVPIVVWIPSTAPAKESLAASVHSVLVDVGASRVTSALNLGVLK